VVVVSFVAFETSSRKSFSHARMPGVVRQRSCDSSLCEDAAGPPRHAPRGLPPLYSTPAAYFLLPFAGAPFLNTLGGGAVSSLPPSLIQLRSSTTTPSPFRTAPSPSAPLGLPEPKSMPSNRRLNLPTRPSSSIAPRVSVPGAHSGLFVTSRVSRRIAGVGAVVYEVNVDPSESSTRCGYVAGRGLGMVTGLRRCDLPRQGLKYVSRVLALEEKFRRDEAMALLVALAVEGREHRAERDVLARDVDMVGAEVQ